MISMRLEIIVILALMLSACSVQSITPEKIDYAELGNKLLNQSYDLDGNFNSTEDGKTKTNKVSLNDVIEKIKLQTKGEELIQFDFEAQNCFKVDENSCGFKTRFCFDGNNVLSYYYHETLLLKEEWAVEKYEVSN